MRADLVHTPYVLAEGRIAAWQALRPPAVMAGARTLRGCDTLPGSHETAPNQAGSCGAGYPAGA